MRLIHSAEVRANASVEDRAKTAAHQANNNECKNNPEPDATTTSAVWPLPVLPSYGLLWSSSSVRRKTGVHFLPGRWGRRGIPPLARISIYRLRDKWFLLLRTRFRIKFLGGLPIGIRKLHLLITHIRLRFCFAQCNSVITIYVFLMAELQSTSSAMVRSSCTLIIIPYLQRRT